MNNKISPILNLILAIALVLLSVQIVFFNHESDSRSDTDAVTAATGTHSDAYANIMTRTSIRQYTDRAVSDATIDSLLRAGMAAPTAVNKQPWQFVAITDRALLDTLATKAPGWKPVGRAPLAIVACGDTSLALDGDAQAYWIQDVSAATENILLAANAMGLGAVWCGAYPIAERVETLRHYLSIPGNIIPFNIIAIGYPAEKPMPKEKYKAERIHKNRW